jgi:hypothetical protein
MRVHVVHVSMVPHTPLSTALVCQMAVLGSVNCFNVFIPYDGG